MNFEVKNSEKPVFKKLKTALELLTEKGESDTLDFKRQITSTVKIAKTIVAFANNKGGSILIGVDDDKKIKGIVADEERYMMEQAAQFFCKPAVEITFKEWYYNGKTVLETIIAPGNYKPYYAKGDDGKWWVYIRVKDQSLLASKIVVEVLKKSQPGRNTVIRYSSKEKELMDYLKINSRITLKQYCKLLNLSRWRASKIVINLVSVGVIRMHTTDKEEFYTLS